MEKRHEEVTDNNIRSLFAVATDMEHMSARLNGFAFLYERLAESVPADYESNEGHYYSLICDLFEEMSKDLFQMSLHVFHHARGDGTGKTKPKEFVFEEAETE